MHKGWVVGVSIAVGLAAWLAGGPDPLSAGPRYLLILGAAGIAAGLLERDLGWTSLLGLYGGQLLGILGLALARRALGGPPADSPDVPGPSWTPLFVLSFFPMAVLGAAVGASLSRRLPASARSRGGDRQDRGSAGGRG